MMKVNYTKIDRWLLPHDSVYSIVNKFMILNHIRCSHTRNIFKATKNNQSDAAIIKIKKWNYNNVNTFSEQKIQQTLLGSNHDLTNNYLTTIVNQKDLEWATSLDELRFCEVCLSQGYHAIFHQMYIFQKCPIHDVALKRNCPFCHSKTPYELFNSATPGFACTSCGKMFWSYVVQRGGEVSENLLVLPAEILTEMRKVFAWLASLKEKIAFSPRVQRENISELQVTGKPFMALEDVYGIWSEVLPPVSVNWLHFPVTDLKIHVKITFGSRATENRKEYIDLAQDKEICFSNKSYRIKWESRHRKICHLELEPLENRIFKSIRRHITKQFLRRAKIRCTITALNTWSLLSVPAKCRSCQFGRALFFWRDFWQVHGNAAYRDIYWENAYWSIDGIEDLYVSAYSDDCDRVN